MRSSAASRCDICSSPARRRAGMRAASAARVQAGRPPPVDWMAPSVRKTSRPSKRTGSGRCGHRRRRGDWRRRAARGERGHRRRNGPLRRFGGRSILICRGAFARSPRGRTLPRANGTRTWKKSRRARGPAAFLQARESDSYASPSSRSSSVGLAVSRILSARMPEFWRIAASILPAISGLSRRNPLEFSRPWPRRWLL